MAHSHDDSTANIKTAFFLNLFFSLAELIGGYLTNSLAIYSDALHDLGDTFSLGVSWYLDKVSKQPRNSSFSYGLGRFSLLSAFISSVVLLIGSLYILSEAIPRLLSPEHSNAQGMILFAIGGILINGIAVLRLKKGQSMNEKVIFLHILEDVLGWIAVLITGIIIYFYDIHILDPLLSMAIVLFVLWNVAKNLKATVKLFLQSVPEGLDITDLEANIKKIPHVQALHDTHLWTLDGIHHILTIHIVIANDTTDKEAVVIKCEAKKLFNKQNIEHSTIEIEREGEVCELDNH